MVAKISLKDLNVLLTSYQIIICNFEPINCMFLQNSFLWFFFDTQLTRKLMRFGERLGTFGIFWWCGYNLLLPLHFLKRRERAGSHSSCECHINPWTFYQECFHIYLFLYLYIMLYCLLYYFYIFTYLYLDLYVYYLFIVLLFYF